MSDVEKNSGTHKPEFDGKWVRLGDVVKKAKSARCGSDSYPILSITMHDGIVEQASRFKKSIASRDTGNYKVVEPGQLVVGFPIDEGVIYVQNFNYPGIMSPAYDVWDIDSSRVDPSYLELALHTPQSMDYYKSNLRGTTARRRSLPTNTLCDLTFPLPSLENQRIVVKRMSMIATLLDDASSKLSALDDLVKSQFVEMFGDPNKTQCATTLEDAFFIRDDLRKPLSGKERESMKEGVLYPYYGANGVVDWINQYLIDTNALCFAEDCGSYGPDEPTAYIIREKAWVNNHAHLLLPRVPYFLEYACSCFRLLDVSRFISGTTRSKMTQAQLKQIEIGIPESARLKEFADFVAKVDKLGFDCCREIVCCGVLFSSMSASLLCT